MVRWMRELQVGKMDWRGDRWASGSLAAGWRVAGWETISHEDANPPQKGSFLITPYLMKDELASLPTRHMAVHCAASCVLSGVGIKICTFLNHFRFPRILAAMASPL